jgi:hypothetical protein
MILIITHKEDYTADYIVNKLNQKNIDYIRLNCEDIFKKDFLIDNSFNFSIDGINSFKSVWFRRTKLPDFSEFTIQEQEFLLSEYDSFLKNIFNIINSEKWLSIPNNIYRAENKLLQLNYAKSLGFNIPKTLISTNPIQIKNFFYSNNEKIILKPFYNSKLFTDNKTKLLFTNLVRKEDIINLENLEITPTIFQEYIEKEIEYRITVVDNDIFIASVDSQKNNKTKIDWRRENLKFSKNDLPENIKSKCVSLVKKLGLKFGAIDLIKDINNEYFFIEINPNGQWVWIETDTELKISESIIKYLCN